MKLKDFGNLELMVCTESKPKCGQNGGENNRKGWSVRGPTPITSFLFDGASLRINFKGIILFLFREKKFFF
jgi:hypothetical protein